MLIKCTLCKERMSMYNLFPLEKLGRNIQSADGQILPLPAPWVPLNGNKTMYRPQYACVCGCGYIICYILFHAIVVKFIAWYGFQDHTQRSPKRICRPSSTGCIIKQWTYTFLNIIMYGLCYSVEKASHSYSSSFIPILPLSAL
jgi:hypothetical protein